MLVKGNLRWMVPVALLAAALVPAATAETPAFHVQVGDRDASASGIQSWAEATSSDLVTTVLETAQGLRHGQTVQTVSDLAHQADPTQGRPQDGVPGSDRSDGPSATAEVEQARDDTLNQVQDARNQADQEAQSAQATADNLTKGIPSDPLGYATDSAHRAYDEARGALPMITGKPELVPQGDGQTTVAEPSLIPPILAGTILVAGAAGVTFFAFWLAGSSGTIGAGAAAKSTELRRLLPYASPLFTRFEKETVLGHPRREALYALILQQPGVSLQSLGDSTGLSRTAVLHHLRLLEMQHLVVSKRMGRSRHYYENGGRYGRDAKEAYAILQNQRSKEVADYIRTHPGTMQKELCEALGIQPSIAHWHVRRLQAAQLVDAIRQGRAVNYFPGASLLDVAAQPALPALPEMPTLMASPGQTA